MKGNAMALKEYRWRGSTWQIDDKDLEMFPGAVPVEKPKPNGEKKRIPAAPANKSRRAPKNK